ncbi:MAG TPA: hypothetical protein VJ461_03795 [Candidatus Nanoarchaeia archaeon]|nr:hypothetical protein [Candidatus Nanoarchaeia archaeon]
MKLKQILTKETIEQYLHRYDKEGAPIEFDKTSVIYHINNRQVPEEMFLKEIKRYCLYRKIEIGALRESSPAGDGPIVPLVSFQETVTTQYLPMPFYRK